MLSLVDGARSEGMAIAHENERAYRFQRFLFLWTAKHFVLGYGPLRGLWLLTRPHLNAGMFAIRAGAPHWQAWARRYDAAIKRTGKITPHDQFALNQAIYQDRLPTRLLDAGANWICDRGVPMWNDEAGAFCRPYGPHRTISALHLAGPGKRTAYRIKRTGGGEFLAMIPLRRHPQGRGGRRAGRPVGRGPIGEMTMRVAMIDPSLFTVPYDEMLISALQRRGHRVDFFGKVLGAREPVSAAVPLRQHFYGVLQSLRTERWPGPLAKIAKGLAHLAAMESLVRTLARERPDVIHFQWLPLPVVDRIFLARAGAHRADRHHLP